MGLIKHRNRATVGYKIKEDESIERFDDLFDHPGALSMITMAQDRAFLLSQRQKGRPCSIGVLNMVETTRRGRSRN